jgi:hypothetical protein
MAQNLRKHLVPHRHVAPAADVVAELGLYHGKRRFDVAPLVVLGEEPELEQAPSTGREEAGQEVISCWYFADPVQCEPRIRATAFSSRPLASLPPEGFEPSASTVSSGVLIRSASGALPRHVGSFFAVGDRRVRGLLLSKSTSTIPKLPGWLSNSSNKKSHLALHKDYTLGTEFFGRIIRANTTRKTKKPREEEERRESLSCSTPSRGFSLLRYLPREP